MARSGLSGLNDSPITLWSVFCPFRWVSGAGFSLFWRVRGRTGRRRWCRPGDEVVSGPGAVALDRDGLAALREADRVAALGDVNEAGRVVLLQAVERRVDEPEFLMCVLVGDGDDAGELRCRAAGAAGPWSRPAAG